MFKCRGGLFKTLHKGGVLDSGCSNRCVTIFDITVNHGQMSWTVI